MKPNLTPILDPRDAARVFNELLARRPAYVPEWLPTKGSAGRALVQIFARYMQVVIDRLNQAPDKNLLAFLDMLGISLIPARAARAPVVFQAMPNAANGLIVAGTRLGAQVPDLPDPVMFETESSIAMAAAQLVDVKTLWPARDEYTDHFADFAGGRPFTLFKPRQAIPHELYLAHDTLLAFASEATVEIEFELATPGSVPLKTVWEHWDGQVWRPFKDFSSDTTASQDGTDGLTRSGIVTLRAECGESKKTAINGINAYWVRGRLDQPLPPDPARVLPEVDRVRVRSAIERPDGLQPDQAFADGLQLDVSKTFYPLGQQPQPGSTFYFSSQEVFSKPGATMTVCIITVALRERRDAEGEEDLEPSPEVEWEYWNGHRWAGVVLNPQNKPARFKGDGVFTITVPTDMEPIEVNNQEGLWMRARLRAGTYGFQRPIEFDETSFTIVEIVPPAVADMRLGYTYRSPWEQPEHFLTCNDFQFELHSRDVRVPGRLFPPFRPVADTTPALYLGFDRPLPNDLVSLYIDVEETEVATLPLVWEAWDGTDWRELRARDETAGLRRPGMVSFIAPDVALRPKVPVSQAGGRQITVNSALEAAAFEAGDQVFIRSNGAGELATVQQVEDNVIALETPLTDTYTSGIVSLAALPRFGTPRDWVRVRLKEDGAPAESGVNGMHLNAAWAVQVQTINDEVLGSGTGQPNQTFFFTQAPVLPGEQIEVRELEGARADVELPILREEVLKHGLAEDDIRSAFDPRTGRVTEVWVRWQSRPHLFFSSPDDRHYMVERARGRLIFGDGRNGRLPTLGANNIRARRYQAGGELVGNVPAGTITQLLGAAPFVQGVTNPRAADGGAEGETPEAVKTRGPHRLRHRGRTLAARDYEVLARAASPGVVAARALPATAPNGRLAPGWVTVIIVPQSQEPQPQPSFELRQQVHAYLTVRAPATVAAERIAVIGPTYLPIGVVATVAPHLAGEAGVVERRVRTALEVFLHPLTGGPEGHGWPFGRDVYLSDVAAIVEAVEGVDYAEELDLLLNDTPQGERVVVPPDRIVVAGTIRIEMKAAER